MQPGVAAGLGTPMAIKEMCPDFHRVRFARLSEAFFVYSEIQLG